MLEEGMIQSRGFRNIRQGGQITGFQLNIRTTYYRGVWASLLEGAEITVDGETFPADQVNWTILGRNFTLAELEQASDFRWPFTEPATLTIGKRGGLKPGIHKVKVTLSYRMPYIPESMQPMRNTAEKQLVLVV